MKPRKPRLWVKMVSPRFHQQVESGKKLQTVRPVPKGYWPIRNDRISLRAWTGRPYRSKQRVLREGTITEVHGCTIHCDGIEIDPGTLRVFWMAEWNFHSINLYAFAKADGFADWPEMRDWFEETHGLPFKGMVIKWRLDPQ